MRRFSDAALAGVKKAIAVGAKAPLIASFGSKLYRQANLVTLLAALEATYVVKREENAVVFNERNFFLAIASPRRYT